MFLSPPSFVLLLGKEDAGGKLLIYMGASRSRGGAARLRLVSFANPA